MESSALNLAHQQYRRAEAHLKYKRFDEAVLCHQAAAENLLKALKLTSVPRALESLQLQHDYHIRQVEIVKMKKQQFEKYKEAVELQRKQRTAAAMAEKSDNKEKIGISSYRMTTGHEYHEKLLKHRNIEQYDSLLERFHLQDSDGELVSAAQLLNPVSATGTKQPKDKDLVIEELNTLNAQLRNVVVQLLSRLEDMELENMHLKQQMALQTQPNKTSLHVITDSMEGNSPFVFSPCGELSPEVLDAPSRELPALAPLEMPNFDFNMFTKGIGDGKK